MRFPSIKTIMTLLLFLNMSNPIYLNAMQALQIFDPQWRYHGKVQQADMVNLSFTEEEPAALVENALWLARKADLNNGSTIQTIYEIKGNQISALLRVNSYKIIDSSVIFSVEENRTLINDLPELKEYLAKGFGLLLLECQEGSYFIDSSLIDVDIFPPTNSLGKVVMNCNLKKSCTAIKVANGIYKIQFTPKSNKIYFISTSHGFFPLIRKKSK